MDKYNSEGDAFSKYSYHRAEKRLKNIKGFYRHLFAYCLFTPFTIFMNYMTYWDYKWFWYSIIPWGIGLGIHGLIVLISNSSITHKWEQRKMEQYMQKEKNEKKWN